MASKSLNQSSLPSFLSSTTLSISHLLRLILIQQWTHTPRKPIDLCLRLLHRLHLLHINTDENGKIVESTNLTILNLWLVWWGPMREDKLAMRILAFQVVCGLLGLVIRHRLALWVFREDNLQV